MEIVKDIIRTAKIEGGEAVYSPVTGKIVAVFKTQEDFNFFIEAIASYERQEGISIPYATGEHKNVTLNVSKYIQYTFTHEDTNHQGVNTFSVDCEERFVHSGLGFGNPPVIEHNGTFFLAASIIDNINPDSHYVHLENSKGVRFGRGRGKIYVEITDALIDALTNHFVPARALSAKQVARNAAIDLFALALIDLLDNNQ